DTAVPVSCAGEQLLPGLVEFERPNIALQFGDLPDDLPARQVVDDEPAVVRADGHALAVRAEHRFGDRGVLARHGEEALCGADVPDLVFRGATVAGEGDGEGAVAAEERLAAGARAQRGREWLPRCRVEELRLITVAHQDAAAVRREGRRRRGVELPAAGQR